MQTIDNITDVVMVQAVVPADDHGTDNYATVRYNALKHGVLSKHVVLPHEDRSEFDALLAALEQEHQPGGATELHLVEELAGILWRKQRVLLAEGASINRSLKSLVDSEANNPITAAMPFEQGMTGKDTNMRLMMQASPDRIAEIQEEAYLDLKATWKAASILRGGREGAYEKARRTLTRESREWWDELVDAEVHEASAEGLAEFIRRTLEPCCARIEKEVRFQPQIKAQTMGEGLQAGRLLNLNRYEAHLDRKFERTLAMLIKLKQLHGGSPGDSR